MTTNIIFMLIEALVTLDCSVNQADTLECVMREDGIVVADCVQPHGIDTLVCSDVYPEGE